MNRPQGRQVAQAESDEMGRAAPDEQHGVARGDVANPRMW
jgi:hypothetical protein